MLNSDRLVEVFAVGREDDLFKHVEWLAAEFARLIVHKFVLIVVHQTDPLPKGVANDSTALALLLLTLVEELVLEFYVRQLGRLFSLLRHPHGRVKPHIAPKVVQPYISRRSDLLIAAFKQHA